MSFSNRNKVASATIFGLVVVGIGSLLLDRDDMSNYDSQGITITRPAEQPTSLEGVFVETPRKKEGLEDEVQKETPLGAGDDPNKKGKTRSPTPLKNVGGFGTKQKTHDWNYDRRTNRFLKYANTWNALSDSKRTAVSEYIERQGRQYHHIYDPHKLREFETATLRFLEDQRVNKHIRFLLAYELLEEAGWKLYKGSELHLEAFARSLQDHILRAKPKNHSYFIEKLVDRMNAASFKFSQLEPVFEHFRSYLIHHETRMLKISNELDGTNLTSTVDLEKLKNMRYEAKR